MTLVRVDAALAEPPYEQIRRQLAEGVAGGRIVAGTRLPTVRQFAADLGVAANTVARAYRELEQAGLVETRGRGGTFVTGAGDSAREAARRAAVAYVSLARRLGLAPDEAVAMIRAALDAAT